jgi:hypothetical protein
VRRLGRCGSAAVALILLVVVGSSTPVSAAPSARAAKNPPNFVLANQSGNDFEVESAVTGKVVKDLGGIPGYTNNGMALAPNGRDLYVTVNRATSLDVEDIDLETGGETFIAEGEEPSISPSGRYLAYGTGPAGSQDLVVRDLASGSVRSIDLQALLGQETDLLNASITWVGSRVVVMPGGVANDLMGGAPPVPLPGSCSAVPASSSCLIIVTSGVGGRLSATRAVLRGVELGDAVIGASGRSDLLMATFNHSATVYEADLAAGAPTVTRWFAVPSALPVAVGADGRELFYLRGHGPVSLWVGQVSRHRLLDARMLNANVALAGLAS